MVLSLNIIYVDINEIKVDREKRIRRNALPDQDSEQNLVPSIYKYGLIHPIVITEEKKLVAGERRLEAFKYLARTYSAFSTIPCRYVSQLSPEELKLIELEENIKRSDLTWQETSFAIKELHELNIKLNPEWTQKNTGDLLNMHNRTISSYLQVAEAIEENPAIAVNKTKSQVITHIQRSNDRAIASAMEVLSSIDDLAEEHQVKPNIIPAEESIRTVKFDKDWVKHYNGPKFNLVHCDFPYGMNIHESEAANTTLQATYRDSEPDFWECYDTLVHASRLFARSCHIIFWFDMAQYSILWEALNNDLSQFKWFPIPLVWHKTDNKGILSDPLRRARHVYEAAFYGSKGDRHAVQPIADVHGAPSNKDEHFSVKPEPMLRSFFRMFVDHHTIMLDPTCGSGSALRAAESLACKSVLGLEMNAEFAEKARQSLRVFRNKQFLEKITKREELADHDA